VAALAVLAPRAGDRFFRALESWGRRLARRRVACCLGAGLIVLIVRGALLPWWPAPKPIIYDEFGYLLQADTFSQGRLTNPPHPLSDFFESVYILQHPTYTAKFLPGQGLFLAMGQTLTGEPWAGVLLSCALLAMALCWALQGWLPHAWALFGTLLALPLCITSDWMGSYWGGAVAAIGGALMLGACARGPMTAALACGIGSVLLMLTRPYEGMLVAIPVCLWLLKKHLPARAWVVLAGIGLAGAAWLAYYNYQVTGSAWRLPYVEYERQYASAPSLTVLPAGPPKEFRQKDLTWIDRWEKETYDKARSFALVTMRPHDWFTALSTMFQHSTLVLTLLALVWVAGANRRVRLPLIVLLAGLGGSLIEKKYYDHYAAPLAAAAFILLMWCLRYLRVWRFQGQPVGLFLCRAVPAAALLLVAARLELPNRNLPVGALRDRIEQKLEKEGPLHVVVVRYTDERIPHAEWIYNHADIDHSFVIWAQDLGAEENRRLTSYYHDRQIWLVEPDEDPGRVTPYDRAAP